MTLHLEPAWNEPPAYDALPAVGETAPPLALRCVGRGELSLESLRGAPVLLALWTPRCAAAAAADEALLRAEARFVLQGVAVVVLIDPGGDPGVAEAMAVRHVAAWVAPAPDVMRRYFARRSLRRWVRAMPAPSFLVLDGQGRVVARQVGVAIGSAEALPRVVAALEGLLS